MADTQAGSAAAAAVAATQQPNSAPSTEVTSQSVPKAPTSEDMFARKEKQIRRMQQELQIQRQALEAKAKSYETDYVPKSRIKEDPWSVLQDQGLDYDQLTQQMLQRPNDPMTRALEAKIKALEQKHADAEKQREDSVKSQYDQARKQIASDVKLLVDSNPDFETIKSANMQDAVVELIEQTFNSEGRLMDMEEAAKEIENHLIEEAFKMSQLRKVQARMKPVEPEVPVAPVRQEAKSPIVTTLSNRMPTQPSSRSSEKEKRARAIAAFLGNKT